MSSIYNSKECPQILGKLVCYSDWRKYVNVEVDKFDLHYLYVELNKIETNLDKQKSFLLHIGRLFMNIHINVIVIMMSKAKSSRTKNTER